MRESFCTEFIFVEHVARSRLSAAVCWNHRPEKCRPFETQIMDLIGRWIAMVTRTWRVLVIMPFIFSRSRVHSSRSTHRTTNDVAKTISDVGFLISILLLYSPSALCRGQADSKSHKLNTLSLKLKFFHSSDAIPYDSRTWLCKHFLPSEVKRRFFVNGLCPLLRLMHCLITFLQRIFGTL